MKKTVKKTSPKTSRKPTTRSRAKKVAKPAIAKKIKLKIDKEKFRNFSKSAIKVVGLLLILLLVDLFVQYLNNDYSVAIVNGKRIPRKEYIQSLETSYGAQLAEMMVQEELAKQLGQEKGIEVEEKEIDESYEKIQEQLGGEEALLTALEQNGMTKEELREQLSTELVLKKIIEPTLEYTDEDLNDFFEQYKEYLYEETEDVKFEDEREAIEKHYIEQMTYEQREVVLKEFRDEVAVQINVPGVNEEEITYGIFKATRNLISNFVKERNTN
jgi:hypothetical protein